MALPFLIQDNQLSYLCEEVLLEYFFHLEIMNHSRIWKYHSGAKVRG